MRGQRLRNRKHLVKCNLAGITDGLAELIVQACSNARHLFPKFRGIVAVAKRVQSAFPLPNRVVFHRDAQLLEHATKELRGPV